MTSIIQTFSYLFPSLKKAESLCKHSGHEIQSISAIPAGPPYLDRSADGVAVEFT